MSKSGYQNYVTAPFVDAAKLKIYSSPHFRAETWFVSENKINWDTCYASVGAAHAILSRHEFQSSSRSRDWGLRHKSVLIAPTCESIWPHWRTRRCLSMSQLMTTRQRQVRKCSSRSLKLHKTTKECGSGYTGTGFLRNSISLAIQ